MKKLRSRFGCRLIPAKELLGDIIKRGKVVRAIAMVADQEPTTSEHKHWTRFPEPGYRVLHGARGDLARHPLPGVFHRDATHQPRPLRNGVPATRYPGRETEARGNHRAVRPPRRSADQGPLRPIGPGRTSAGSSRSRSISDKGFGAARAGGDLASTRRRRK